MASVAKLQQMLQEAGQPPGDAEALAEILDACGGDLTAVAKLLGLDLPAWTGVDLESDQPQAAKRNPAAASASSASIPGDPLPPPSTQRQSQTAAKQDAGIAATSATAAAAAAASAATAADDSDSTLLVASWNLNGLSDEPELLQSRMAAAARELLQHRPHLILVQEVTTEVEAVLTPLLTGGGYRNLQPQPPPFAAHYYVTIYSRLSGEAACRPLQFTTPTFMGRYLLNAAVQWRGKLLGVSTSHFESGGAASFSSSPDLRVGQAQEVLATMGQCPHAIFGGDTNLRVAEFTSLSAFMQYHRVFDAWTAVGHPAETKFTWDCKKNDTLKGMTVKPCMRLDHLWFRGLKCRSFELLGTRRLGSIIKFPSDHFGILARFELET